MTNTAKQSCSSASSSHADSKPVTPSNWVKPELIIIDDEEIGGKVFYRSYETAMNLGGPSGPS